MARKLSSDCTEPWRPCCRRGMVGGGGRGGSLSGGGWMAVEDGVCETTGGS